MTQRLPAREPKEAMHAWITRISISLMMAALIAGIIPRALLFYLPEGRAEDLTGEILVGQFHVFLNAVGFAYLYVVQAKPLLVALLLLAGWLVLRIARHVRERRLLLPIEALPIAAVMMVFLQFFADLLPALMLAEFLVIATVTALFPTSGRRARLRLATISLALATLLPAVWLDAASIAALVVFSLGAYLLVRLVHSGRLAAGSCFVLLMTAEPLAQIFSAWLPATIRYQEGTQISPLPALSFCESEGNNLLFAVHPQCPLTMFAHKCRDGFIGVYERTTLAPRREIRPFNADYFGRPEQLICRGNQLYVGMNGVRINGVNVGANTMLVDYTAQNVRTWKNFAGAGIGNSLVYDARNDALFLSAEFGHRIYRWDFAKQQMQTHIGDSLPNPWYRLLAGETVSGSTISHHDGISEKHNAAYFAEWIHGRYVHEVDLATLKARRHLRTNGGASLGATVDEENERLWVSHLWGISVFALKTGRLVAKHRTGFMNRPAVIDRVNDLVFSGATISGRVYVFDRKTMKKLGALAIGIGPRYLAVSRAPARLYVSSWSGAYAIGLSPQSAFVRNLLSRRVEH